MRDGFDLHFLKTTFIFWTTDVAAHNNRMTTLTTDFNTRYERPALKSAARLSARPRSHLSYRGRRPDRLRSHQPRTFEGPPGLGERGVQPRRPPICMDSPHYR